MSNAPTVRVVGWPATRLRPGACRRTVVAAVLWLLAASASAEVTRIDITSRRDVLAGKPFGDVGPYEVLTGRVHFAVDPANPRNRVIADIDAAPRNASGHAEFSADLHIVKPRDPSRGNGVLFFDVVNRGSRRLLSVFSRGTNAADPATEADFGDASLLVQGYTLVAIGWQFDVPEGKGLSVSVPTALEAGKAVSGWIRMWVVPDRPVASIDFATASYNTTAYPPIDPANPSYRLTTREGVLAPPTLVPRERWGFGRDVGGTIEPSAEAFWVEGGLRPGLTYELAYQTQGAPIAGLGFAAIRDVASALKHGRAPVAPGRHAYMYGASQTGRAIRHLIYDGFTVDEQGRAAFDAAFIHTGATGRGSFNERFAQPNELGSFTQTKFPILYRTTIDPVTGVSDGLGARIPAGLAPKLFLVDTSSEYWDRGRVAALRHVTLDGKADLADAPNVRVYSIAGTQHGSGSFPPQRGLGQHAGNANDYRWAQRGLLAALDAWVRRGVEPPASRHPRLDDGTLVEQRTFRFPAIPGVQQPTHVPGGFRPDVPAPYSALPFLVPAVDADGNETSGIVLPELAVPLATMTGWQFRSPRAGSPHVLLAMAGAYLPFPRNRAEREMTGDPRRAIDERYADRADYLRQVEAAAQRLARERYLLADDIAPIVERAAQHWDWLMAAPAATASGR